VRGLCQVAPPPPRAPHKRPPPPPPPASLQTPGFDRGDDLADSPTPPPAAGSGGFKMTDHDVTHMTVDDTVEAQGGFDFGSLMPPAPAFDRSDDSAAGGNGDSYGNDNMMAVDQVENAG
jgi:hypothetical protein